jgi:hypothetical protein
MDWAQDFGGAVIFAVVSPFLAAKMAALQFFLRERDAEGIVEAL